MDQKTLIGFILIGAILLFWPTYLDFISPEPQETESVSPVENAFQETEKSPAASYVKPPESSDLLKRVYTVETPLFTAGISNKNGGSLSSFLVTKHLKDDEGFLDLIDEENKNNLLVSYINQSGEEVFLDDFWSESKPRFVDGKNSVILNEDNPTETLSYVLQVGEGFVQKDLTFFYNSYEVVVNTNLRGIKDDVLDGNFRLDWVGGLPLTEPTQDGMFLEGLVGQGGDIESFKAGSTGLFGSSSGTIERSSKQYTGPADFAGYRTKYFGVFFVPQKTDFVEIAKYSSGDRIAVDIITNQNINFEETTLYFGPLEYGEISNLGVGIEEKILGWQWLSSVSWLVYSIMIFMYSLIPNYGVVVILFAILIKTVTYPLMAKQLRSSKKMQEINPLLNDIKNKYKNNPTVQQQKIAALFQENKINPLAGCLPMLIQMPVLMSVFMVFRNTIEFRGESFVFWISDLSAADTLFFIGEIPFNVLPFLMSASMYYTMQAGMANQPSGGDPAQEATQKMMKYMFPGMMFFLFYSFPSGLNLYYLCFNVMQIAQQKIINKED
ncbi:membrane protein insertase YidC [Candidatus Marinimicrobia bacterium]|nr:membrane protein insertase YidC [Candidatus Neomarinimicrobiota bacterium]